jgi:hypothetical protein
MATPIFIALHPSPIKHSSGVMTDLFFGSMLLWAAFLLWTKQPTTRTFLRGRCRVWPCCLFARIVRDL